jgi:hypothetical protein
MKIGILYICTGKYDAFWDGFHKSAELYLLNGVEKHYFVFTDSKKLQSSGNIHVVFQERLGWPKDTLMRFHIFHSVAEQLKKMDYLFFFNANYTFVKNITQQELLPVQADNFLVGQLHPVAYHKKRKDFDYESNADSTAYISSAEGVFYYAGGLIGGRTPEFLKMCIQLKSNIDKDLTKNIIAKWHDESHINKYFSHIVPKKLHPGYCYPQGWFLPFERKTLLLDKNKFGGHAFMRGSDVKTTSSSIREILFKFKQVLRAVNYKLFGYSPL